MKENLHINSLHTQTPCTYRSKKFSDIKNTKRNCVKQKVRVLKGHFAPILHSPPPARMLQMESVDGRTYEQTAGHQFK